MLGRYAASYALLAAELRDVERILYEAQLMGVKVIGPNEGHGPRTLHAVMLARSCADLLPVAPLIPEIDRLIAEAKTGFLADRMQTNLHGLIERLIDHLSQHMFQHVPPDLQPFYGQKDLFGPLVAKKFAKAREDIENAGNCYALGQPSACVFHLMRAMEVVVRKLGARLKVTITPQTTWRQITGHMDDKIKKMPEATDTQKRKKENWEACRANLHHVGSVWRNRTMHPARSYTVSQARDVLNAVRTFMTELCAL